MSQRTYSCYLYVVLPQRPPVAQLLASTLLSGGELVPFVILALIKGDDVVLVPITCSVRAEHSKGKVLRGFKSLSGAMKRRSRYRLDDHGLVPDSVES